MDGGPLGPASFLDERHYATIRNNLLAGDGFGVAFHNPENLTAIPLGRLLINLPVLWVNISECFSLTAKAYKNSKRLESLKRFKNLTFSHHTALLDSDLKQVDRAIIGDHADMFTRNSGNLILR